ncbi:MAG: hypothetical protein WC752_00885 [Patescibacteria group bacterium]|jgi:hypothetical protein
MPYRINQSGKIKTVLLIIAAILLVVVIGLFAVYKLMFSGAKLSDYEYLKEPQISEMAEQSMMVISLTGDADATAGDAISVLYKAYYQLDGVSKGKMPAPKARWQWDQEKYDITDEDAVLTGEYGLPIPDSVKELPAGSDPRLKIKTWEYGQVAEILHVGDYNNETPTIDKLHKFIEDQGYEIIGDHEEEYAKGPGMFGKGNPDKYLTIIRYQIKKL